MIGDLDRDVVDRAGGELLVGHLEAAVAVDRPHRGVGPADLRAHGRRHRVAHRAEAAGVQPGVGLLVRDELRRPHLVLPDAGDVDRVRAGDLAEPLDDVLRGERAVVRAGRSRAGRSSRQLVELRPPAGAGHARRRPRARPAARRSGRRSTSRQSPTIGTSAVRFLRDLGGVDVGVDRPWRRARSVDSLPVTRSSKRAPSAMSRSDFCSAVDGRDRAVHARHAEVLRVAVGERAARHQRRDDRDAGELGQRAQLGRRRGP